MIVRLGESLWSRIGLLWIVSDVPTSSQTGLPRSRKSQGKTKIFQGQGKVREFLKKSGKIFDIVKVSEKSGNSVFLPIVHKFSSRFSNSFSLGKMKSML